MLPDYYKEKAAKAGLTILTSDLLNQLVQEQVNLVDNAPDGVEVPHTAGDESVLCDRDEGYFSCILDILGLCARFPGRKTWVIANAEGGGYSLAYLFAEDSIRAATARVRREMAKTKKNIRRAKKPA